jgi:DnaK suppressor protein
MADIADKAQAVEEQLMEAALSRRVSVDPLDRRVVLGQTGGECLDCGEEIPEARLRANPAALRCVDCQQDSETARHA